MSKGKKRAKKARHVSSLLTQEDWVKKWEEALHETNNAFAKDDYEVWQKVCLALLQKGPIGEAESVALPPRPPLDAEFILHLLLRHDEHDAVIGDLVERYGKKVERLGMQRANIWFYLEVFWSALPLIKRAVAKASGLIAAGEFIRRHIH
jgi:hypothetical protein